MVITCSPSQNTSSSEKEGFWTYIDELVESSQIVIDRPKNSEHPQYPDLVYPLDYGYLDGTLAIDGGGIDVWVGSLDSRTACALVLTVDLKKRDAEVKILLGCTDTDQQVILNFLNTHTMRAILTPRYLRDVTLLQARRSVRSFKQEPVPRDVLVNVLEAATWAPSAHNRQPWRFAVLVKNSVKTLLAEAMGSDFRRDLLEDGLSQSEVETRVELSRRRILEAPVAVVICLDSTDMDFYPDEIRRNAELLMAVQSVAMAGENMLLAAHAEDLGGVWMCAPLFTPVSVRRALKLPSTWQPQGLILLGYPAVTPKLRSRRPVQEVTLWY